MEGTWNPNQMTHHHLIIIQARGWSTAQDQRAACLALDTTSPDLASWLLFITTLFLCSDATSLHCTTHFPVSILSIICSSADFMFLFKLVLITWFILLPPKKKTSGNHQPKPHSLVCCSQLTVKREKKKHHKQTPTSPKRQNKTKRNRNKKKFKEDSEPVCHALRKRGQDLGRQTTGSKAQRQRQRQRQSRTDTTRNTNAQFGRVR